MPRAAVAAMLTVALAAPALAQSPCTQVPSQGPPSSSSTSDLDRAIVEHMTGDFQTAGFSDVTVAVGNRVAVVTAWDLAPSDRDLAFELAKAVPGTRGVIVRYRHSAVRPVSPASGPTPAPTPSLPGRPSDSRAWASLATCAPVQAALVR
jgi:hypothetical protein